MHPIKSIIARNQNRIAKNFGKSKYGKVIRSFKDTHKGERCFVIGNGPSLKAEDLTKIHELKIPTFAANKIFKIFDKTDWRPDYYICEDAVIAYNIVDDIEKLECKNIFMPIDLKWYQSAGVSKAKYFNMTYNADKNVNFGFTQELSDKVSCCGTVTITAMQFAAYMGFTEIYLIGVDHNFAKMIDVNGNVIENDKIKNHFDDSYEKNEKKEPSPFFNVDNATEGYMRIKKYFDERNINVFNATRGGKLEVYERVDLDEFFRNEFSK